MTIRYAPRQLHGSFPDETAALADIRKTLASADESRPPEMRFQLALLEAAQLEDSGFGYKLLAIGEEEFILFTAPGACEVYHAMQDMIADTEEEAHAWIEEAEAMGVQAIWRVFHR